MRPPSSLLLILALSLGAEEPPLVLTGLDPVHLVEGVEQDGSEDRSRVHDGFTYLFASETTRARFDQDPARYAVQYGGLCARMGGTTIGNPDLYAVHEGRLYLFGSPDCVTRFRAEPAAFVERVAPRADVDAAARMGGAGWSAKALAATGGAEGWRQLGSWRERATTGTRSLERAIRFDDRLRLERTFGQFRIVEVVTPEAAFVEAGRGPRPLRAAQSDFLRREAQLAPAALMRSLAHAAATLDPADRGEEQAADGRRLRRLELALGRRTATLLLDVESGRPVGVRTLGRVPPAGHVGLVTEWWEDWRPVGGVSAPWRRRTEGLPPEQALVFSEIVANPPLSDEAFASPTPKP